MWTCFDFGRLLGLKLTTADEVLAVENMDVLSINGFELEQIEEHDAGDEDKTGSITRLHLVAQPKNTTFDMKGKSRETHENDGSTLELSSRSTDDGTFVGFDVLWAVCTAPARD